MADVAAVLEDEGVASFAKSYEELLQALARQGQCRRGSPSRAHAESSPTPAANPLAEGLQTTRRAPPGVLVVFGASG